MKKRVTGDVGDKSKLSNNLFDFYRSQMEKALQVLREEVSALQVKIR